MSDGRAAWGRIDVLTRPVDGPMHGLSDAQGDAIVARLKPRIVIPTHCLAAGVSSTPSTLQPAGRRLDAQSDAVRLDAAGIANLDDASPAPRRRVSWEPEREQIADALPSHAGLPAGIATDVIRNVPRA